MQPDWSGVPCYLGQVLSQAGSSAGTCFQVADGVLVTALHVLTALGCGGPGDEVTVEELDRGQGPRAARVLRVDGEHDLAVLRTALPFPASVPGMVRSDLVPGMTAVRVQGSAQLAEADEGAGRYKYVSGNGQWEGPAMRGDRLRLAVVKSEFVRPGMSGAPVRRAADDWVAGVVLGYYNSDESGGFEGAVWLARVEDLLELLRGIADVLLDDGMQRVRSYTDAASRRTEFHPYLGLEPGTTPALADVYLSQRPLPHGDQFGAPAPLSADRVRASELAAMGDDCLVVAGPGMGKTSLMRLILRTVALQWAAGGVSAQVPVPVLASDLLGDGSIPEVLARAVEADLGQHALLESWPPEFFAAVPGPGVRWLLLVDGIDEILDAAGRVRVLRKLADLAGPGLGSRYRVIATTRPLADAELNEGLAAGWRPLSFGLQPFTEPDISELAQGWFQALGLPSPGQEAALFTTRLADFRLTALAGTPLMAAMLCRIHAADREKPLPRSRGAIYAEFTGLLHDNVYQFHGGHQKPDYQQFHGRRPEKVLGVAKQAESLFGHYSPAAAAGASQVLAQLLPLLARLAAERRSGKSRPAMDIIAADPVARRPDEQVPAEAWRDFLHSTLRRSGLLDIRGGDFVFLHRTLMDYLDARYHTDRPAEIRKLLKLQGPRKDPHWYNPRGSDPSFLSFLLDPGPVPDTRPDGTPDPAAGISPQEIQALLMDICRLRWPNMAGCRFVAEQVRLGTAIPDPVTRQATSALQQIIREHAGSYTSARDSVTAARNLVDLDRDTGLALLESLALNGEHSKPGYHGDIPAISAVREVLSLDRDRGAAVLRALIPALEQPAALHRSPRTLVAAARMLAEVDRGTGVEFLRSLASDRYPPDARTLRLQQAFPSRADSLARRRNLRMDARIDAATALARFDPQAGGQFLAGWAASEDTAPDSRAAAARALIRLDRPSGILLLADAAQAAILAAIHHQESLQELRDLYRGEPPDGDLKEMLDPGEHQKSERWKAERAVQVLAEVDHELADRVVGQFTADRTVPGRDRNWLTVILTTVRQADGHAEVDGDLADVDQRWLADQLRSLHSTLMGRRPWSPLGSHLAAESPAGPELAVELVPDLLHPGAARLLRAVARSDHQSSRHRFDAIARLHELDDAAVSDLLDAFARTGTQDFHDRLRALRMLRDIDAQRTVAAVEGFTDNPLPEYLSAILSIRRLDTPEAGRRIDARLRETPAWRVRQQLRLRWALFGLRLDYGYRRPRPR